MKINEEDIVSATEVARGASRLINGAAAGRRFIVMNSNEPTAAIIGMEDLRLLDQLASAVDRTLTGPPAPPDSGRFLLDAVGITDIASWDPRQTWEETAGLDFRIPLGVRGDGRNGPGGLVAIDATHNGDGRSGGVIQGITGSGKSVVLAGAILGLCSMYGPDKVALILMDFKGTSTFAGFEALPQVIALIDGIDLHPNRMAEAVDIIRTELARRDELLNKWARGCDATAYWRLAGEVNADLPPLPRLVIVLDEFQEFLMAHPEHASLLEELIRKGPHYGMHVILSGQQIPAELRRSVMENIAFGVCLKVRSAADSRAVLAKTYAAKDLPTGAAIIHRKGGSSAGQPELERFTGFDIETRCETPTGAVKIREALISRIAGTVSQTSASGLGWTFDNPKAAALVQKLSSSGLNSVRRAATEAGYKLPPRGQDIGTPVAGVNDLKPGDVIMGANNRNGVFLGVVDGQAMAINEQGEVEPLDQLAVFDGPHEGLFRLPDA